MVSAEVVIVSGSYGAGHDAAAGALAEQLRDGGHQVRLLDVAEELPAGIGPMLRWVYFAQLRLAPHTWASTLRRLERGGWGFRVIQFLLGVLGRRLVRQLSGARLVVSTHPFASQALGQARAHGRLGVPVVTYLTDASVHRLWVHPAVDLHLAMHELTARQAATLGGTVAAVRPVVSRTGSTTNDQWQAPWPSDRPAALVVGGSRGVGELYASALDLIATGLATPVVACGTNVRLRLQLEAVPGVVALGWRDDMSALLAGASCVVQNAGGMTSLEALDAGTPTITYRAIPGHGTSNASVLSMAGLVPWITHPGDLAPALARVLTASTPCGPPAGPGEVLDVLRDHHLLSPLTVTVAA